MILDEPAKILLVGNASDDRSCYRHWLTQAARSPDTVVEVTSTKDALAHCHRGLPHVICLDYDRSTAADGDWFLAQVQQSWPAAIAVIVSLPDRSDDLLTHLQPLGVQDFWIRSQVSAAEVQWRVQRAVEWVHLQRRQQQEKTWWSHLPDGYLVTDRRGIIQDLNPALLHLLHRSREHCIGTPLADWIPAPDRESLMPQISQLLQGDRPQITVDLDRLTFQNAVPITLTGIPIADPCGQIREIRWLVRDISHHHQAQLKLQQTELKYRTLIEQLPGVVYLCPLSTTLDPSWSYISPQIQTLLGVPQTEWLSGFQNTWSRFAHPDDRDRVFQEVSTAIQQGKPLNAEYRMIRADGQTLWVRDHATPIVVGQPDQILLIGFAVDITAQKQAEAALRESDARFRQLAESIQDVFFIYPADDNRPIYMSPAYEKLWGHSPDRLQEQPNLWLEAIHPDDRAQIQRIFQQGAAAPSLYEYRMLAQDGALHWMRVRMFPIFDDQGQLYRIAGIAEDMTDRKQFEDELTHKNQELKRTNQALERATRLKDEFLATMSHELRTPLNAIMGLSEGLIDRVYGEISDRQQAAIATIKRSGGHLLALINDILDIVKIEAGQVELEIAPVTVRHLCEFSLSFVEQLAQKKHIKLTLDSPAQLGEIPVDARRMRQVLVNLLSNAVKFTPPGGKVSLTVQLEMGSSQCLEPSHERGPEPSRDPQAASWIAFAVQDTGIGIAPENLGRLFQTFVQLDSDLNRQYSGTGLGLALVRRITEMHGGCVSVESTVGQGSCFTVRLPYTVPSKPRDLPSQSTSDRVVQPSPAPGTQSPVSPADTTPSLSAAVRILLVEDNLVNRESTADYLLHRGYQVTLATNGVEALQQVQSQPPDVILMDLQMPGMDGVTTTQILRRQYALQDVIIIALTARITPHDREQCFIAGVDEYLVKPVPMKRVIHTIEQLLGKRRRDRYEFHPHPLDRGR